MSRLTIHLRSEGDRHRAKGWQPFPPVPSARSRQHSNSFSGPDQTTSVSTYAGQRWARSEKGKNKSLDISPPESLAAILGASGSMVLDSDKDLEKSGESSRLWRKGSSVRKDTLAPPEEQQRERTPSWMDRIRSGSRRDPDIPMAEAYLRPPFPQTMASWDTAREAGPSPIEAAALSIRRSEEGYAFSMPDRPPVARLADEYI